MNSASVIAPLSASNSLTPRDHLDSDEKMVGFVAMRWELTVLVKEWYSYYLEVDWTYFTCGCASPASKQRILDRLDELSVCLGKEECRRITKEAFVEFGKSVDPALWNIFLHGSEYERNAVQIVLDRAAHYKIPLGKRELLRRIRKITNRLRAEAAKKVMR
jgi:hypothetical protein